jgi:plastocyanin
MDDLPVHRMKLLMGFIILLVALVAITGCTQPASTSAQNTTTAPLAEVTTVATPVATTVFTTVPVITSTTVANVTAPVVNVTTAATVAPVNVTPTATPASGVTTIHMTSAAFTPQTDIVLPGTAVSFVNNDNVSLSIMTIGNNTGMFNSGPIIPTSAFKYTFSQNAGSYVYQLSNNANVNGTIIVSSPSNANHSSS